MVSPVSVYWMDSWTAALEFLLTRGVYAEQVTMTMQQTLEQWTLRKKLRVVAVTSGAVRTLTNKVSKKLARPGRKDIAMICAARDNSAFVLTHDSGAAGLRSAVGLVPLDIVDVALFFEHSGTISHAGIEGVLAPLNNPGVFRPADWAGSARATQLARPHSVALCERMRDALGM